MFKAIIDWIKHLFHIHNWIDETKTPLFKTEQCKRSYGVKFTQKCSVCSKRRVQMFIN